VDWDGDCAPIRVLHYVVATSDPLDNESGAFERPDYLRSRYDRDATWHNRGSYQKSGDVECQSQLIRRPDYIQQSFKCHAQVVDRLFLCRAIADSANARAQLGRGTPDSVLVLLDNVGHMNGAGHDSIMQPPTIATVLCCSVALLLCCSVALLHCGTEVTQVEVRLGTS
jgi:hypothetical protein